MRLDTLSYLRDLPLLSGVFLFLVLSFIFFFLLLRMYLVETSLISFFFFTFGVVLLAYFLPWVLLYFYLYLYTHCPFCPQRRCLCLMMRNSLRANRLRCRASRPSFWRLARFKHNFLIPIYNNISLRDMLCSYFLMNLFLLFSKTKLS